MLETQLNPDPEIWDAFIENSDYGGFMQSSNWEKVKREEGWGSFRVAILDNNTIQAAALVLSLEINENTLFLYSPQGPVLDWHKPKVSVYLDLLSQVVADKTKGQKVSNWRIEPWALEIFNKPLRRFIKSAVDMQPRHTALIPLIQSEELFLQSLRPKVRYNIRLAEKHGLLIKTGTGEASFKQFYRVYRKTIDKKKIEFKDYSYFGSIQKYLGKVNQSFVLTAFLGDKAIASILLIRFGNRLTYFFGGFDYQYRQYMAPYYCHLEAMRLARSLGCDFYDLWGISNTDNPDHPWYSFTEFKLKFNPIKISLTGAFDIVFDQDLYAALREGEEA